MGKGGDDVVIGYKYHAGMHMVLCHGPIDAVIRARCAERDVFSSGYWQEGPFVVDRPWFFGGEEREGGIKGFIDFGKMGAPDQEQSSYLQQHLGVDIPAFRGVVSAVFSNIASWYHYGLSLTFSRGFYFGNNPYLKPWDFRVSRVYTGSQGKPQWYGGAAGIGYMYPRPISLMIALDTSGSMDEAMGEGQTRISIARGALKAVLGTVANISDTVQVDLALTFWGGSTTTFTYRNFGRENLADAENKIDTERNTSGTNFETATVDSPDFYLADQPDMTRIFMFITDGQPNGGSVATAASVLFSSPRVESYAFNIALESIFHTQNLDNTPEDGVPVITTENPGRLGGALLLALGAHIDMNPAHIIRECLTDQEWGMGYDDSTIDDDSFMSAADALALEGFGISLIWEQQAPIIDFVGEINRHIDSILYVDGNSGKFKLKLIRDDYDVANIPTLSDLDGITTVNSYSRIQYTELINTLSVRYWDHKRSHENTATSYDAGLLAQQGREIGHTVEYPGITNQALANRIAERDLRQLSTPMLSATIECNRKAATLQLGDVFSFEHEDYHQGGIVMRVVGLAYGDHKKHAVKIQCIEDMFALNFDSADASGESEWEDPEQPPEPGYAEVADELPYYNALRVFGADYVASELEAVPETGWLVGAIVPEANELNAGLYTDRALGLDIEYRRIIQFSGAITLAEDAGRIDTVLMIDIESVKGLENTRDGLHAKLNNELIRIDTIDDVTGEMAVGRGVLDTVPQVHTAGDVVVFWGRRMSPEMHPYVAGETVQAQMLTSSGTEQQVQGTAPVHVVTMAQRAIRPYPPGNVFVNGESLPEATDSDYVDQLSLSWSYRDRLQQTGDYLDDYFTGNIGPEDGTTYNIEMIFRTEGQVDQVLDSYTGITNTIATIDPTIAGSANIISITSERDGLRCLYPVEIPFVSFGGPAPLGPEWQYIDEHIWAEDTAELIVPVPPEAHDFRIIMQEFEARSLEWTAYYDILYVVSTDGGLTYEPAVTVATERVGFIELYRNDTTHVKSTDAVSRKIMYAVSQVPRYEWPKGNTCYSDTIFHNVQHPTDYKRMTSPAWSRNYQKTTLGYTLSGHRLGHMIGGRVTHIKFYINWGAPYETCRARMLTYQRGR